MNVFFKRKTLSHRLRDSNVLIQPKVRTVKNGLNTFTYQGAKLWNTLPIDIKSAPSLSEFKSRLWTWQGPECTCHACIICQIRTL